MKVIFSFQCNAMQIAIMDHGFFLLHYSIDFTHMHSSLNYSIILVMLVAYVTIAFGNEIRARFCTLLTS